MRVLLLILAVLTVTTANATPIEKGIAKCSAIKDDLARLECFDQLAIKNNLQGKQLQPVKIEDKGKWRIQTQVNPVDDSKTSPLSSRQILEKVSMAMKSTSLSDAKATKQKCI